MSRISRRRFVRTSAAAAAGAATFTLLHRSPAKAAANDRVSLCVVGIRGRGKSLPSNCAHSPNSQITHVCDVNATLLGPAAKAIADIQKSEPKVVQDLRRVLEDGSVDALVVATPDHWHALATIWGCQAGK